MQENKPKIFIFDIETTPLTAYVWGLWSEARSFDSVEEDWCVLSWCGKWLDEDQIYWAANNHKKPLDDSKTLAKLWEYLNEADIVVAHNGNKFDIKKVNARFLQLGLQPPSPYRKIDTLLEARKNFAFTSNRLDVLGQVLGLGRKIDNGGFKLWVRCMNGEKEAFDEMVEYNVQDVSLLEDVYLALRPWMQNHPNIAVFNDDEEEQCPKCGSDHLQWRGYATTQTGKYKRFQCQSCGGWGRARASVLPKEKRKGVLNNIQ